VSDPKPLINLPPQVQRVVDAVKSRWTALSRPAKVMLVATAVAATALVGTLSWRSAHEPYSTLYSQLDRDDAAALVAKLKEMKVPYRLSAEGTAIEVPEAKVHEVRLDLASAGLPRGGGVGFESFDKTKLGASDFEQRVLFRRALEGELSRTIGSISSVQSARVHLVLPERSVFVARNEAASASVVVGLRQGRMLSAGEVAAIVHLVSSAVPSLSADRVALVTTGGQMLHRPRVEGESGPGMGLGGGGMGDDQASILRSMESQLEERTRAMLERHLGPGHVDVKVSADVDFSRVERAEEHYDPLHTVLRSETATTERQTGNEDPNTVAGVPGAESNLPTASPGASANAGGKGPPPTRESHTRNYEVDKISEKKITTAGTFKRVTVAVLVDSAHDADGKPIPRSAEDLAKIAGLVRSAVGADDKRGDMVTVEALPFSPGDGDGKPVIAATAPAGEPWVSNAWAKLPPKVRKFAPAVMAGIVVVLGANVMIRRRRAAKKAAAEEAKLLAAAEAERIAALPAASGETPAEVATAEEEPALPPPAPKEARIDLREMAHDRAAADPATAALVLKWWLGGTDEPGAMPPG
jgi:flagellar M-ring protein FliF